MDAEGIRQHVALRGKRLEYFTIGWNTLEGLVAVAAGAIAGSISLLGFGVDSFIEVASGGVLLPGVGRLHRLRLYLRSDQQKSTRAQHPRNHFGVCLHDRDACAFGCQEKSRG